MCIRDRPSVSASATIHVSAPAPAAKAGTWKRDGRGWWYRYEDGTYPADTTLAIDGATYRFDAHGYMRTGWVKEQGSWYYHKASGEMCIRDRHGVAELPSCWAQS